MNNTELLNENQHVEKIDGVYRDMLIEQVLECIWHDDYTDEDFDDAFNIIIKRYIHPEAPTLRASYAGSNRVQVGAIHFFMAFNLDFSVISSQSPRWPTNGFDMMPEATCAVALIHADDDTETDMFPGVSLNQAALGAFIQYARELALRYYNEPQLDLSAEDASTEGRAN